MKKRDLEKSLRQLGWRFLRHGKKHDVWTDGEREEAVPRHREINEILARVILRRAGEVDMRFQGEVYKDGNFGLRKSQCSTL